MRFPLFALIAPLVTSVVLWVVTGSAYTLLFALLGPVMALAQFLDGRFHTKREAAKQAEREDEEELAQSQQRQLETFAAREQAHRLTPPSSFFARAENVLRPPWAAGAQPQGENRAVRVGIARAGGLPALVELTKGIALRGDAAEVRAVMRAIAFQLAWNWGSCELTRVGLDFSDEPELVALFSPEESLPVSVSALAEGQTIPLGVRYLLTVDRGVATLLDTVDGNVPSREISVDLLTRAEVSLILPKLLVETPVRGGGVAEQEFPNRVAAVLNTGGLWESAKHSLVVNVGRDASHPLLLDLVTAGPHAIVTGMTGSGKTEFLRTWLVAMASSYSPEELSILVIDFKGGAGFAELESLPHLMGVVTDLDHLEAHRAMTSLQAEVRYRERVLALARVGDISVLREGEDLPRLIVVVDEYRAVVEAFPDLLTSFVDLAARGRALGIHLILSSQRVGGALGDALLANCALRVGFRVSQKQDSHAVLGNDAALLLPHIPGRGSLAGTGLNQREFQAAQLTSDDMASVQARVSKWSVLNPSWSPRTPWLPPLPATMSAQELPTPLEGAPWLGLADLPEHQVQSWAQYSPGQEGNLLITGPARSGRSHAVALLAQQLGVPVISSAELAWDVVADAGVRRAGEILIMDDLDAILDAFDVDHREEFMQRVTRVVRTAPKHGGAVILSCSEHLRGAVALLALFPSVLTLLSPIRPGRALWHDHELQLVKPDSVESGEEETTLMSFDDQRSYLVISHRTRELVADAREPVQCRMRDLASELSITSHGDAAIVLGTPEEWMSQPHLFSSLKQTSVLVLDDCTSAELRGLRLRSGLFPHTGYGKTLVVEPDGSTTRVIL